MLHFVRRLLSHLSIILWRLDCRHLGCFTVLTLMMKRCSKTSTLFIIGGRYPRNDRCWTDHRLEWIWSWTWPRSESSTTSPTSLSPSTTTRSFFQVNNFIPQSKRLLFKASTIKLLFFQINLIFEFILFFCLRKNNFAGQIFNKSFTWHSVSL